MKDGVDCSMKKMLAYSPIILCILFAVIPIVAILVEKEGFSVELYYPMVIYVALVIIELAVWVAVKFCNIKFDMVAQSFLALFCLISVICAGYYGTFLNLGNFFFIFFIQIALISVISAGITMENMVQEKGMKIAFTIITLIVGIIVAGWLFLNAVFGGVGLLSVVYSKESPDGKYIAEIVDDDQGALGGSTIVRVTRKESISFGVGNIHKDPTVITVRRWGMWDDIEFEWVDEDTLLVDGTEYTNGGAW